MSKTMTVRWTCDRCGRAEEASTDLEYMPEGWVHSMVGDDLCERCAN